MDNISRKESLFVLKYIAMWGFRITIFTNSSSIICWSLSFVSEHNSAKSDFWILLFVLTILIGTKKSFSEGWEWPFTVIYRYFCNGILELKWWDDNSLKQEEWYGLTFQCYDHQNIKIKKVTQIVCLLQGFLGYDQVLRYIVIYPEQVIFQQVLIWNNDIFSLCIYSAKHNLDFSF